jgi:hypothetical protein
MHGKTSLSLQTVQSVFQSGEKSLYIIGGIVASQ